MPSEAGAAAIVRVWWTLPQPVWLIRLASYGGLGGVGYCPACLCAGAWLASDRGDFSLQPSTRTHIRFACLSSVILVYHCRSSSARFGCCRDATFYHSRGQHCTQSPGISGLGPHHVGTQGGGRTGSYSDLAVKCEPQRRIIWAATTFEGTAWVKYDSCYRRRAARLRSPVEDVALAQEAFAGRARVVARCTFCLSWTHTSAECLLAPEKVDQGRGQDNRGVQQDIWGHKDCLAL